LAKLCLKGILSWFEIPVTNPFGRYGHQIYIDADKIYAVGGFGSSSKKVKDFVRGIELTRE
jgi:hypothetical protein